MCVGHLYVMANKKQTEKDISAILRLYDKKHLRRLLKSKKFIDELYDMVAREAARIGTSTGFDDPDKPFRFEDYPAARKRVDDVIKELAEQMQVEIEQGSKDSWLNSAAKNAAMIDRLAKGTKVDRETIEGWKKPNLDAFEAFQQRKVKGMGLSDRVWRLSEQMKSELELALDIGLGEGKSAAQLSRDVRKYLNEPNKLFRRVRDKHGNLRLSQAAQAYHPGQGVYRSSYKNAIRLTATENNMAYYSADNEHWGRLDFVIGKRVQLSNNHTLNGKPFHDICDELQGDYPKDFQFKGWHPFCRCYMTPILADWDEQLKVMKMQKEGKDVSDYHYKGEITEMPKGFNDWIENNQERIARAKSMPYFIKDNFVGGDVSNGLRWELPVQQQTGGRTRGQILDAAEKRHASRTKETAQDIQNRWDLRKDEMQYSPEQREMFRDIEKNLGITRGFSMPVELADRQNANPNYGKGKQFGINCQTCAPAYVLREWGFDVSALGNPQTPGNLSYYLSKGNNWRETWLDKDGNAIRTVSFKDYAASKGWKQMNAQRYRQYFDEVCAEDGTYEVGFSWKGKGGHCTIVKRKNGVLTYIEPQIDNSPTSNRAWDNIDRLCQSMTVKPRGLDGAIRADNACFNTKFVSIFDKNSATTLAQQRSMIEATGASVVKTGGKKGINPLEMRFSNFSKEDRRKNIEKVLENRRLNASIIKDTDTRNGRLRISLSADNNDLVDNITTANSLLNTFGDMKITIREHYALPHVKNPEYMINGMLADRKSVKDYSGISNAFKNARSQFSEVVVIDLDKDFERKRLDFYEVRKELNFRRRDFVDNSIKECYFVYNKKAVKIDRTILDDKGFISKERLEVELKKLEQ